MLSIHQIVGLNLEIKTAITGLQIFFQEWWAQVTHGAKKNGGLFSEMMGPSISN